MKIKQLKVNNMCCRSHFPRLIIMALLEYEFWSHDKTKKKIVSEP